MLTDPGRAPTLAQRLLALQERSCPVKLPSGTKVLVPPEWYGAVLEAIRLWGYELGPAHVLVEPELEGAAMAAGRCQEAPPITTIHPHHLPRLPPNTKPQIWPPTCPPHGNPRGKWTIGLANCSAKNGYLQVKDWMKPTLAERSGESVHKNLKNCTAIRLETDAMRAGYICLLKA